MSAVADIQAVAKIIGSSPFPATAGVVSTLGNGGVKTRAAREAFHTAREALSEITPRVVPPSVQEGVGVAAQNHAVQDLVPAPVARAKHPSDFISSVSNTKSSIESYRFDSCARSRYRICAALTSTSVESGAHRASTANDSRWRLWDSV